MSDGNSHKAHLSADDHARLRELRARRPAHHTPKQVPTRGALLADKVAEIVGSWRFIIIQRGHDLVAFID